MTFRAGLFALAGLLSILGLQCASRPRAADPSQAASGTPSNVFRRDYVGSQACAGCHGDVVARFERSAMHRMTRPAGPETIAAPFDGARLRLNQDHASMFRQGERYFVDVASQRYGRRLFRVTKVIGGRLREDYVGREVDSTDRGAFSRGPERVLPVSFLSFENTWRYKGYSVLARERPGFAEGIVWRKTCIFCHNTAPALSGAFDELFAWASQGRPSLPYQGSVSLELPPERGFRYRVTDEIELLAGIADELEVLGQPDRAHTEPSLADALSSAIDSTRSVFDERHLVELGIGCEACHGGGREHVANVAQRPSFLPQSGAFVIETNRAQPPTAAQALNLACARCHTVLFTRYPHTWEGGDRDANPGGSQINSGEARDFLLGGCSSALSCARCHDAHGPDATPRRALFESPTENSVCTDCHRSFEERSALAAHTHHAPDGQGSACLNCHMPKKNMGLDYRLTRYHRIGSPTDAVRVYDDRPLECALCHADKSVGELVTHMERFWNRRYDRGMIMAAYGPNLEKSVLEATFELGKPHEKAVALALAAEHRDASQLHRVVAELDNPYPLIRFWAADAIRQIRGQRLEADLHLPGPELVRRARIELGLHSMNGPAPGVQAPPKPQ